MISNHVPSTMPKLLLVLASLAACGYATRCEAQCYKITITTADEAGAGTDSDIFITLRGATKSERIRVSAILEGNLFEQGHVDSFVWQGDVGPLESIVVESDGKHPGSDWRLASVYVIRLASAEAERELNSSLGLRGVKTRGYQKTFARLQGEGKIEVALFQHNDWVTEDKPAVWTKPGLIK